jgi:hypothetical protein
MQGGNTGDYAGLCCNRTFGLRKCMADSYNRQGRSGNLAITRNWGAATETTDKTLIRQLDDMYFDIANAINGLVKKNVVTGANPPASSQSNKFLSIGDITVRTDTNAAWIMTSRTTDIDVVWTIIT